MIKPSDWHKTKFYFLGNPVPTQRDWNETRIRGRKVLTDCAQLKLEWIIFYYTDDKKNAKQTAVHFGITRKTFHKWLSRFKKYNLKGLEELSTAPNKTRTR